MPCTNYPPGVSTRDIDDAAAERYADGNAYVDYCPACGSEDVSEDDDGLLFCDRCGAAAMRGGR